MDAVDLLVQVYTSNRFNLQQCAVLISYFHMGMVGTGKVYSFRHERAAAEVVCTVDKVMVCLRSL